MMNNDKLYFWFNGEVFIKAWGDSTVEIIREVPCLDTSDLPGEGRYGMFREGGVWADMTLDEFPPEFRVHLLLLGVS